MNDTSDVIDLDQLCAQSGLPRRTVRYYVQIGLVDRPIGTTRGAHYTQKHLDQLIAIRKWREAGFSLERIGDLLREANAARFAPVVHDRGQEPTDTWRRIRLADGVELHVRSDVAWPSALAPTPDMLYEHLRTLLQSPRHGTEKKEDE
jgi:DNA-binding transcriptional MerR regulator